ncbi:MFS general substrate transporter [Panus rudis PR-1116 ss-1]|nr:MFS general substrate transporter [Panus rudis PR-1116 ss-1]
MTMATSPDERRPLLADSPGGQAPDVTDLPEHDASATRTPLPKAQLAVVFLIKLLLPVSLTQPVPYLNLMLEELPGITKDTVGYYSGIASTTTHVAQLISIYAWSRISDRIGRVPVLLIGTSGIAIFNILFGLSKSFTAILVTRFLVGIFVGTTGAIHSIVGELTEVTNQGVAFPLYDIIAALGFIVGPLIGGTLANPTRQPSWPWPRETPPPVPTRTRLPGFSPFPIYPLTSYSWMTQFFEEYPYLLPCLATAALAVIALLAGIFVLEETLSTKRKSGLNVSVVVATNDDAEGEEKPLPLRKLLSIPVVLSVCLSSFVLGGVASAFNSLFVLVAYTRVDRGGLGLDPRRIGNALSIMGGISILLKYSLTHLLKPSKDEGRIPGEHGQLSPKPVRIFELSMWAWPVTFAGFIALRLFAEWLDPAGNKHDDGGISGVLWVAVSCVLLLSRVGSLAFTLIMILAKEASPSSSSLGSTNGVLEFAQLIAITAAPVISGSLFAFSITHTTLGGYLWVFVCIIFSAGGAILAARVSRFKRPKTAATSTDA